MARVADKVAFITGGASGLGRASALRLAEEGAKVAVVDRNGEGAEAKEAAALTSLRPKSDEATTVRKLVVDEPRTAVAEAAALGARTSTTAVESVRSKSGGGGGGGGGGGAAAKIVLGAALGKKRPTSSHDAEEIRKRKVFIEQVRRTYDHLLKEIKYNAGEFSCSLALFGSLLLLIELCLSRHESQRDYGRCQFASHEG